MSFRRRILNLVTRNPLTGVYSLHRLDLRLPQNNLFNPTARAALDAAAAKDPDVLFAAKNHADDGHFPDDSVGVKPPSGEESLNKVGQIQLPAPSLSFQPTPSRPWISWMDCVALSENKMVFLQRHSSGAFLYDAGTHCLVTLPSTREPCIYFPVADGDGCRVYAMDVKVWALDSQEGPALQFKALVHRPPPHFVSSSGNSWRWDELSPPPFFCNDGGHYSRAPGSNPTRRCSAPPRTRPGTWSKTGDWALPFCGKIEHDGELGAWLGFLDTNRLYEHPHSLLASGGGELFSSSRVVHRQSRPVVSPTFLSDDYRDLKAPYQWRRNNRAPKIVSLGSGKFCVAQFFETTKEACSNSYYKDDKRFAVFTGVEVISRARNGDDHDQHQQQVGNEGEGQFQVVIHKSKCCILTQGETITSML
ncbi:hypothetical protein BS78_05G059200 [Paspalum vaginatum]|nr:hypothetical protein BS78_05G059200 [Paspalum vaginatum]